jgi:glycosyltransferase involved in cell wall biosynthesis
MKPSRPPPSISVAIIARDEAHAIADCLRSVAWADERIVLDSGSTDDTVAIARGLGARVEVTDWPGYGAQKNRALALCSGDWILSLDADEQVSDALRDEIQSAVSDPGEAVGFRMPRLSSYCGRRMRHGGWWPDHVLRLFRRGHGRFSDDAVHERLIVDGRMATLRQPLLHDAYVDLEEVVDKVNRYSSAGARQMYAAGRRTTLPATIGHAVWAFIRTYVLRAGFLDGREGFLLAVSNAEGTYYRYAKLLLLQERADRARRRGAPPPGA